MTQLVSAIDPRATSLILGAGASVPSGAPTGRQLADALSDSLGGGEVDGDLTEVASILVRRHGRKPVVDLVRDKLRNLEPTTGLLALPQFPWREIYTTNFDLLVETVYKRAGKPLAPVRSNFEYARVDDPESTPLFKIHGCVTQDVVDGDSTGMTLTYSDYEQYREYRETIFSHLSLQLQTRNTLILGQSLADRHLKDLVDLAIDLTKSRGATGRVFVTLYDHDIDRAGLIEDRGASVCFAGIDEFIQALLDSTDSTSDDLPVPDLGDDVSVLPSRIWPSTTSPRHAEELEPNVRRLFKGGPASYADIRAGYTFARDLENPALESLRGGNLVTTIVGAGGVGKTTAARRLVSTLAAEGYQVWEHRANFPLQHFAWLEADSRLREAGDRGVLLIDNCPPFLSQANKLMNKLHQREGTGLQILLTANSAEWNGRIKSPAVFSGGEPILLSRLSTVEIGRLLNLVGERGELMKLVDSSFARLNRQDQEQRLRLRCKADMYVCLMNIFGNEDLEYLLLVEFAELDKRAQDVYRNVCLIEATGAQAHRQLCVRLLGLEGVPISSVLNSLDQVVEEFDIKPSLGLYGWCTRHSEIARTIAKYKFSDDAEREDLLSAVIETVNPISDLERAILRQVCDYDFGVCSLTDRDARLKLLRRIIERAPDQRIPRHRLIGELLAQGRFGDADNEIDAAEESAGTDPPLARYRVRVLLQRALKADGLLKEDRAAIMREASRKAQKAAGKYPDDKGAFDTWIEVGEEYAKLTGDPTDLEEAYLAALEAYEHIQDPALQKTLEGAYAELRRYTSI
ncbi:SIR2 family NAD-dependent protein deacylase [Dermatobacter hominis]|uniref:SIR2 family NAD-dependent protein deacylase n=1 Tax=Dermatobacter hominis TaxID=2884263 RepID=UPI001D1214E0|nr:SIR2 family protein [Dermatobacter hominis]UDY34535.1 SIR2 family protein [Dermatobacter hominis]